MAMTYSGAAAEVGTVGNEGVTGVALYLRASDSFRVELDRLNVLSLIGAEEFSPMWGETDC